jgi:hypothetical protein
MSDGLIVQLFHDYVQFSIMGTMMPLMIVVFFAAVFTRICLFYTIKKEKGFIDGVGVRAYRFLEEEDHPKESDNFHLTMKKVLDRTFEELFIQKKIRRARNFDRTSTFFDRLFMIESASTRFIHDSLLKTRRLSYRKGDPEFEKISRYVVSSNPIYNKLFGFFPSGLVDDILNVMPGLFIIGGILGTFIGILGGLPELKTMDVTSVDSATRTLNDFLTYMGFAMISSVLGIFLSILFTLLNTTFSHYQMCDDILEGYTNTLEYVWKECGARSIFHGSVEEDMELIRTRSVSEDLKAIATMRRRYTIKEAKLLAKKYGGKCLSESCVDSRSKLEWECTKNHKWVASPGEIDATGVWCTTCEAEKIKEKEDKVKAKSAA